MRHCLGGREAVVSEVKNMEWRAVKMARRLRALAVLSVNPGLILRNHVAAYNYL